MTSMIRTILSFLALVPLSIASAAQVTEPVDSGAKFPHFDAPESTVGSLAIRAVQGTPGGPAIAGESVEVDLVHRGTIIRQLRATLDEHGVVVLEDLPVEVGFQPVVRILYNGVAYQQNGAAMDVTRPQQTVDVICYQLSIEPPPWRVAMRHVMIQHAPEGALITEVVVVDNASDVTWSGVPDPSSGRSLTLRFALPEEAKDLQLGKGFHGWCCSTIGPGLLQSNMPLMPGRSEYSFSYILPARKGAAAFTVVAAAPTDHMMVIMPDDVGMAESDALTLGGTDTIGDTRVRYYTASAWGQGQNATISLSGLSSLASTGSVQEASSPARVIAVIGGALIILLGAVILLKRSPKQSQHVVEAS